MTQECEKLATCGFFRKYSEVKDLASAVSQVSQLSGCRITGIRECSGDNVLFASVVIMVNVFNGLSPESHVDHNPANANKAWFLIFIKCGFFSFHSMNPSAGIRQRCLLKDSRKLGFSLRVSERAFMSLFPMLLSLDQDGISPHFIPTRFNLSDE